MKNIRVGTFKTNGKLIVTDPCYKDQSNNNGIKINVKPGIYNAYLTLGRLKNPIFPCDKIPEYFRVAKIMIVHQDHENITNFKQETQYSLSIDSGQYGFFNEENFYKPSLYEYEMHGERLDFFRSDIISQIVQMKRYTEALDNKNDLYDKMLIFEKERDAVNYELNNIKFFERCIEQCTDSIERSKKILETKIFPDYIPLEKTNDFYEIICDMTSREHHGGTEELYGDVSRSGLGDGCTDLFTAIDNNQIVAAYLPFIELDELIKD